MNKEIKEQWLKALRSGEYKQTTHTLRDEDGYCCLGVLCDIMAPGEWIANTMRHCSDILPLSIAQEAGLSKDPMIGGICISKLNDNGMGFLEIADIIEREL